MNPLTLVYKLTNHIINLTTQRPLRLMAAGLAAKDTLLGLGFIYNLSDIAHTLLYQNFNGLAGGEMGGMIAGILLVIFGVYTLITSLVGSLNLASYGLRFEALFWLFSTIMYILNGQLLLALTNGIFFTVASGYLAFLFKWMPYLLTEREKISQAVKEHQQQN